MSDERALDELLGHRRATHPHEWTIPSGTVEVNRSCDQVLAGSGLTNDADWDGERGDPFYDGEQVSHPLGFRDDGVGDGTELAQSIH